MTREKSSVELSVPDASSRKEERVRDFDYVAWAAELEGKKEGLKNGRKE